ncbi:MAG: ribonuclease III, partial [Planctomycetes bacterium DG_23]
MRQDVIKRCEKAIGYKFSDPALLQQALTHASSKGSLTLDNERLEFLGDAVLGAI